VVPVSGVSSLSRRTVVVGQKAKDGSAARGCQRRCVITNGHRNDASPSRRWQARVMPLHGLLRGLPVAAPSSFMQSSDMPEIGHPGHRHPAADAAGGTEA